MTDTLKMIDEARDWLENSTFANAYGDNRNTDEQIDVVYAALSALKKMASGEDWFDISELPDVGHVDLWIEYNDRSKDGFGAHKCKGFVSTIDGKSRLEIDGFSEWDHQHKTATKFKHTDNAKHIDMLIQRELKDGQ